MEAEVSLHKMKTALDDTRQENTELVSKVVWTISIGSQNNNTFSASSLR